MLGKTRLKYIQTLGQKKFRDADDVFIAEGPKLVAELLTNETAVVKEIFAVKEWIDEHATASVGRTVTEVSGEELERISQLTTPNKVLAVVAKFTEDPAMTAKGMVTLAIDGIRDPGNLGTIIRIADWFGVTQLICSIDSADIYNPKVVQATMGSIGRVHTKYCDLRQWIAEQQGIAVYAAALGGEDVRKIGQLEEAIIVIGNESRGIAPELLAVSQRQITIPGSGRAESLNAAVATGIILSHLLKQ
jgi:TrmH family RNA methyltransferase